jgi:hypothetical protein
VPPVTLEVTLTQPVQPVYTRGTVSLAVGVKGGVPDTVEVLQGTRVLATLTAPYTYTWDTRQEAEGTYMVSARATVGGRSFGSTAVTVVVDRTAPTVVSRSPAPGATGVVLRGLSIEAVFSEPLLASTVVPGRVAVTAAQQPVAVTPSLSGDGRTLSLTLGARPALPATLGVTLGNGLTDLAGNPVAAAGTWNFSLPEWLKMESPQSAPGLTQRPFPSIALDENGRPIVAWTESINGAPGDVRVRRWNGTAWEDMGGPLSGVPGNTQTWTPSLAVNDSGMTVVAWDERVDDAYNSNIYVRRWTGSAWEPLEGGLTGKTKLNRPYVVVDSSGTPFVAYGGGGINRVYRWSGTIWQFIGDLRGQLLSLELTESGIPVVSLETGTDIKTHEVKRYLGSGLWGSLGSGIPVGGAERIYSPLSVGGENPAVAVIEQAYSSSGNETKAFVWRWAGTEWQQLGAALTSSSVSPYVHPALMTDVNNVLWLVWPVNGSDGELYYTRWIDARWETPKWLNGRIGSSTYVDTPSLVMDLHSIPLVVWAEGHGTPDNRMDIYLHRYNN